MKAMQLGKPKYYAIRELIQNALDEKISTCTIETSYFHMIATISVEDDGPGFRDITDSYTLFKPTYKQSNPELRGRWNMGEKQSFAICKSAVIETTSGLVVFDEEGKHIFKSTRTKGTKVTIKLNMTKEEYNECLDYINKILIPKEIKVVLNNEILTNNVPLRSFETSLKTEKLSEGQFTPTIRKTKVEVYETPEKYLYEMGIPICPIECEYSINVLQRVPMGIDRDTVSQAYLQDIYAELLNNIIDILPEDKVSQSWVRIGMSDDRISNESVKTIIKHRFGDKTVIANPKDAISIDDAISSGYNVVYGREMSKEEWNNVKRFDVMQSSTELFGHGFAFTESVQPTPEMERVARLTKKIAAEFGGIDVNVNFIISPEATNMAQYGNQTVTFNVSKLPKNFFENPLRQNVIGLILHELCHEYGHHTEAVYHEQLTLWGASLVVMALNRPSWFDEFRNI